MKWNFPSSNPCRTDWAVLNRVHSPRSSLTWKIRRIELSCIKSFFFFFPTPILKWFLFDIFSIFYQFNWLFILGRLNHSWIKQQFRIFIGPDLLMNVCHFFFFFFSTTLLCYLSIPMRKVIFKAHCYYSKIKSIFL